MPYDSLLSPTVRRPLVCLRWGIGDLVMELPLLRALRRHLPRAHITALGARPATDLLAREALVDEVAHVQDFGLRHWGDPGPERARQRLDDWCRDQAFDCVLDGSHAPRGARAVLMAFEVSWLDTGACLASRCEPGHGTALLRSAARNAWGIEVDEVEPRLHLQPDELAAAARAAPEWGSNTPVVIGVAAMASSPLKRASAREFARTADELVRRYGCRVLIFEAPDDDAPGQVRQRMRYQGAARLIEPQPLRRTAALLGRCSVVLCNDTGLMHVAAAVGVPVVAVFACTAPALYLPRSGRAVQRWRDPCRRVEAPRGGFGVTPCVYADRCLDAAHNQEEDWANEAVAAAAPMLSGPPQMEALPRSDRGSASRSRRP